MDSADPGFGASARLDTPRLRLLPPTEADPAELAELLGNYDVVRWLGRVPYPYTIEHARAYVARAAKRPGRSWLIFEETGLVGGVSVDEELGYWIARHAWGRGYASEAAAAAVGVHFSVGSASDLRSGYFLGNRRSARVLGTLGFEAIGMSRVFARALSQEVARQDMVLRRERWNQLQIGSSCGVR